MRDTFFSRVDAVCERGVQDCENNGQAGWGWYQRTTERAKFRRVVVDAKGQGEFGLLMQIGEEENGQEKSE